MPKISHGHTSTLTRPVMFGFLTRPIISGRPFPGTLLPQGRRTTRFPVNHGPCGGYELGGNHLIVPTSSDSMVCQVKFEAVQIANCRPRLNLR